MLTPPEPLRADTFNKLMAGFAPFEARPTIAVAVSGGADSMALAILSHDWARERGGVAHAFVVDHGLRAASGEEAATVAGRCNAMGLKSHILVWPGTKPTHGIQAAAREARYNLLAAACQHAGILHLLTAHHRDDQAETVALRAARASTPSGMAGMSAVMEWRDLRLVRPVLTVAKDRLIATVRERGIPWVEDPSNLDPAFARGRLRRSKVALPAPDTIFLHQRQRVSDEARTAGDLAQCVSIWPAGNAALELDVWSAFDETRRKAVIVRVAMAVGGLRYPPRGDRLARFCGRLADKNSFSRATLGRCLWRRSGAKLLVTRENRGLSGALELAAGETRRWDGRFLVTTGLEGAWVAPLGGDGWSHMSQTGIANGRALSTAAVLPAFYDLEGLAAVPYLHWTRGDAFSGRFKAMFAPHHPLAPAGFARSKGDLPALLGAY